MDLPQTHILHLNIPGDQPGTELCSSQRHTVPKGTVGSQLRSMAGKAKTGSPGELGYPGSTTGGVIPGVGPRFPVFDLGHQEGNFINNRG